jgi:hypothetical protein
LIVRSSFWCPVFLTPALYCSGGLRHGESSIRPSHFQCSALPARPAGLGPKNPAGANGAAGGSNQDSHHLDAFEYYDIVSINQHFIMTDVELTRALERGEIVNHEFHHASHLHVAWVYLSESKTLEQATERMCGTLRRFAGRAGKPEKYHQTVTVFWMRILAALRQSIDTDDIEPVLRQHPELLDKNFPLEYYSRESLFSDCGRTSWIEPDLKRLPTHATPIRSSGSTSYSSHRLVRR